MAHGMPDYNRDVRPKYGGAVFAWGSKVVTLNAYTLLLGVTGKGVIYGGAVSLDHTATQRHSYIALYVDGDSVLFKSFYDLNKYAFVKAGGHPLCLTKYDDVNFVYSVQFPMGITFETHFNLNYVEAHGGTPNVHHNLTYALI